MQQQQRHCQYEGLFSSKTKLIIRVSLAGLKPNMTISRLFSLDRTIHSSSRFFFFRLALLFALARIIRNIRIKDLHNRWSSVVKNAFGWWGSLPGRCQTKINTAHIIAKWDCIPSWPQTCINRTSHAQQAKTVLSFCWILHCLAFYLITHIHAKEVNKMQQLV